MTRSGPKRRDAKALFSDDARHAIRGVAKLVNRPPRVISSMVRRIRQDFEEIRRFRSSALGTPKDLRLLADGCERLAAQFDRLQRVATAEVLAAVPMADGELRTAAAGLRRIAGMAQRGGGVVPRSLGLLIGYVRLKTGRSHYRELADLLAVTAPDLFDEVPTEEGLRQWARRNRSLTRVITLGPGQSITLGKSRSSNLWARLPPGSSSGRCLARARDRRKS